MICLVSLHASVLGKEKGSLASRPGFLSFTAFSNSSIQLFYKETPAQDPFPAPLFS